MQDATQNQTAARPTHSVYSDVVSGGGLTRLRSCPPWCTGHDDDSLMDFDTKGLVEHSHYVAGGLLGEVRRCGGDTVTRPGGAGWDVVLTDRHDVDRLAGDAPVPDTVIELDVYVNTRTGRVSLGLLPGEARNLAAALTRAANQEMFR